MRREAERENARARKTIFKCQSWHRPLPLENLLVFFSLPLFKKRKKTTTTHRPTNRPTDRPLATKEEKETRRQHCAVIDEEFFLFCLRFFLHITTFFLGHSFAPRFLSSSSARSITTKRQRRRRRKDTPSSPLPCSRRYGSFAADDKKK